MKVCYILPPNAGWGTVISQNYSIYNVQLYNIIGKKVYQGQHENRTAIDVQQFAMGMYVLQVSVGKETLTKKIVIVR